MPQPLIALEYGDTITCSDGHPGIIAHIPIDPAFQVDAAIGAQTAAIPEFAAIVKTQVDIGAKRGVFQKASSVLYETRRARTGR